MNTRAILFDLDGTLHDRAATLRAWLAEHTRQFGLPDTYAPRFLELEDHGYRPKAQVIPQLVQELDLPHDPQTLLDTCAHHVRHAVPMPHAHAVLRELRARGVRVGVVTNGWEDLQRACSDRCGLTDLTDDLVISRAVGLSKPDPRIYLMMCEALAVEPAACVYLDDLGVNCKPAAQLGMKAIKVVDVDQTLGELAAATGLTFPAAEAVP